MGECYDVRFKLKYTYKPNAISALSIYVIRALHKPDLPIYNSMSELMKYILPQTCHWYFDEESEEYFAAFDANYGWYTILHGAFSAMSPWLADGATMEIWPGNAYEKVTPKRES